MHQARALPTGPAPAGEQIGRSSAMPGTMANTGDSPMVKVASAVAAILLISSAGALAQGSASAKACAADVKAQCASVQPGDGRVGACVKKHFDDLSGPCQRNSVEDWTCRQEGVLGRRKAILRRREAGRRQAGDLHEAASGGVEPALQGRARAGCRRQELNWRRPVDRRVVPSPMHTPRLNALRFRRALAQHPA